MDANTLIGTVTSWIAPVLPLLIDAAKDGASELGKKAAGEAWDGLVGLWKRLSPRVQKDDTSKAIVDQLAANPEDRDSLAAFRMIVGAAVKSDPALAQDLGTMVAELERAMSARAQNVQQAHIHVGGNVDSSTLIIGRDVNVQGGSR
ncbi:hypothetical protein ACTJLD_06165 [Burkholderia sp. 22088]|uniref:hypothetical protein n=1 Tax=Burkholderia sp. 22088 TaxID=3453871 RepID=UPI003F82BB7D